MYGESQWLRAIARPINASSWESEDSGEKQLDIARLDKLQEILQGKSPNHRSVFSAKTSTKIRPTVVQVLFPSGDQTAVEYRMYDLDWQTEKVPYIPPLATSYSKDLHTIGKLATNYMKDRSPFNVHPQGSWSKKPSIEDIIKETDPVYPIVGIAHFHHPLQKNAFNESLWAYYALRMIPENMYPELSSLMEFFASIHSLPHGVVRRRDEFRENKYFVGQEDDEAELSI